MIITSLKHAKCTKWVLINHEIHRNPWNWTLHCVFCYKYAEWMKGCKFLNCPRVARPWVSTGYWRNGILKIGRKNRKTFCVVLLFYHFLLFYHTFKSVRRSLLKTVKYLDCCHQGKRQMWPRKSKCCNLNNRWHPKMSEKLHQPLSNWWSP